MREADRGFDDWRKSPRMTSRLKRGVQSFGPSDFSSNQVNAMESDLLEWEIHPSTKVQLIFTKTY